ncbi:MAG: hypothetical protein ACTJLM_05545 [Ehrlichia sp.]
MDLVLLPGNFNGRILPFLSSGKRYVYDSGKFHPKDKALDCIVCKEEHPLYNSPLCGAIFNKYTIVTNKKSHVNEEIVLLDGLNNDGFQVFLMLLLGKSVFNNVVLNDPEPVFIITPGAHVVSGLTRGRTAKDIVTQYKGNIKFTVASCSPSGIGVIRFDFRNCENKITDCVYCSCYTTIQCAVR